MEPEIDETIDCSGIKFCCGPCVCKLEEVVAAIQTGDSATDEAFSSCSSERIFLKPYSGGRYASLTYYLYSGVKITTQNVRLCAMCNQRYMEQQHDTDADGWALKTMHNDAMAIYRKLR